MRAEPLKGIRATGFDNNGRFWPEVSNPGDH